MFKVSEEEFEDMVSKGIDAIPEQFAEDMDNVAIVAADEPTEEERASLAKDHDAVVKDGEILGLYVGIPITERPFSSFDGETPDVISIFKGPHERMCSSYDDMAEEVRRTVVHEVGHYFGMDDSQLHAMGY